MNGFTSGLQALLGRAGSQKCYDCGDPATHQYRNAYGLGKHMPVCETDGQYYRNQGESVLEYSVLDNPILAEFRSDQDGTYERICWWLAMLEENVYPSWTPEQLDHARRVLMKLAALNA